MKGQAKAPKLPEFVRVVVADNVERRMNVVFAESTDKPMALSLATGKPRAGGISKSTIQRIIKCRNGPSIDKLELIAEALGLAVYQLFIPKLDEKSPYVIPGAEMDEMRLFKEWKRREQEERDRIARRRISKHQGKDAAL